MAGGVGTENAGASGLADGHRLLVHDGVSGFEVRVRALDFVNVADGNTEVLAGLRVVLRGAAVLADVARVVLGVPVDGSLRAARDVRAGWNAHNTGVCARLAVVRVRGLLHECVGVAR